MREAGTTTETWMGPEAVEEAEAAEEAEVAKAEAAKKAAGYPRPTRPYRPKSDADFAEEAARKRAKRFNTEGAPPVPLQTRTNASGSSAPPFSPAPGWSCPSAPSSPRPVGVSEGHGVEPQTRKVTLASFRAAADLADWRPPEPPRSA